MAAPSSPQAGWGCQDILAWLSSRKEPGRDPWRLPCLRGKRVTGSLEKLAHMQRCGLGQRQARICHQLSHQGGNREASLRLGLLGPWEASQPQDLSLVFLTRL